MRALRRTAKVSLLAAAGTVAYVAWGERFQRLLCGADAPMVHPTVPSWRGSPS
jgi:hypothetical protein